MLGAMAYTYNVCIYEKIGLVVYGTGIYGRTPPPPLVQPPYPLHPPRALDVGLMCYVGYGLIAT
jgi:hypothetical protein